MIKKERVKGTLNNLIETKRAAADGSERGTLEAVAYDVADAALIVYADKIRAGLRRAGIEFADGENITSDKIFEAIKAKSGIDLRSFDIEEIKAKALQDLSTDISERLGFDIDLKNGIESGLNEAVEAAIRVGGSKLLDYGKKQALRRLKLADMAGVSVVDVKRYYNAQRQREFRQAAGNGVWVAR